MTKISRREQIQERRHRVWELHCQGFTQTEIANNYLHHPPRTVCRDIALVKRARDLERKRRADQQEYESTELIEELKTSLLALNRKAHIDFESLDIKNDAQAEWRLALYTIIGQIQDSRLELSLMADGVAQREATAVRLKAAADSISNQLKNVETTTTMNNSLGQLRKGNSNNNGSLQEEHTIV